MVWLLHSDTESEALKELYSGSDRGAAIIAATIIEARLDKAIKSRFTRDKTIENEMFRSSGALGSFSAKIKLACLMGVCSKDAYKDLEVIKNVRNKFAHKLDVKDFDAQQISAWCHNLKLIEKCVWESTKGPTPNPYNQNTQMFVEGRDEKFKSPKWRYLLTAMLFSNSLHQTRSQGPNI